MGGRRSYPSPALVVAFVALVAALSGTAVALPGSNTVTSGDIKNGQVRSRDLRNNDVRGGDVRTNTLKGSDIDESSLGRVPAATSADSAGTAGRANSAGAAIFAGTALTAANASSIGGATLRTFHYEELPNAPSAPVLELAGLSVEPNCDGGDLDVIATAAESGALLSASEDPANSIEVAPTAGSMVDLVPTNDDDQVGHTEWATDDGAVLTINWQADFSGGGECRFAGTAVGTG